MIYEITGGNLPVVKCKLNKRETMVTQSGGMSWRTKDFRITTRGRGGLGKMLGRALAGESLFQNIYTALDNGQEIAFASSFPGEIMPVELGTGKSLIIQKQSFLAAEEDVTIGTYLQEKISSGLFGGEGFIMLRLSGKGMAFLEVTGSLHEHTLRKGEKLIVSTGHIVALDSSCGMSIEKAGNAKNMLLGGEGFFNTVITGPGKVYTQSMPLRKLRQTLTVAETN